MEGFILEKAFDYKLFLYKNGKSVRAIALNLITSQIFQGNVQGMCSSGLIQVANSSQIRNSSKFYINFSCGVIIYLSGLKGGGANPSIDNIKSSYTKHFKNNQNHQNCKELDQALKCLEEISSFSPGLDNIKAIHPIDTFHSEKIFLTIAENFLNSGYFNHPLLQIEKLEIISLLRKYYFFSFSEFSTNSKISKNDKRKIEMNIKNIINSLKGKSIIEIGIIAELNNLIELINSKKDSWLKKLAKNNPKIVSYIFEETKVSSGPKSTEINPQDTKELENYIRNNIRTQKIQPFLFILIEFYINFEKKNSNSKDHIRNLIFGNLELNDDHFLLIFNTIIRNKRNQDKTVINDFLSKFLIKFPNFMNDEKPYLLNLYSLIQPIDNELLFQIKNKILQLGEDKLNRENKSQFKFLIKHTNSSFKPLINEKMIKTNFKKTIGINETFGYKSIINQFDHVFFTSSVNKIRIYGQQGSGKSSICYKFIQKFQDKFNCILIFDCENNEKFQWEIIKCCKFLDINTINAETIYSSFIDYLNKVNKTMLILFDNVIVYSEIEQYLVNNENVKFLIITTDNFVNQDNIFDQPATFLNSEKLIRSQLRNFDLQQKNDLKRLAEFCAFNPSKIKIILIHLISENIPVQDYCNKYLITEGNESFFQDILLKLYNSFDDSSKFLLKIVKLFDFHGIPKENIKKLFIDIRKCEESEWIKSKNVVVRSFLLSENEDFFVFNKNILGKLKIDYERKEFNSIVCGLIKMLESKNKNSIENRYISDSYSKQSSLLIEHIQKLCHPLAFINYKSLKLKLKLYQLYIFKVKMPITNINLLENEILIATQPENRMKKKNLFKLFFYLGNLFLDLKSLAKSEEFLKKCIQTYPIVEKYLIYYFDAQLNLGITYRLLGKYKDCFSCLKVCFKLASKNEIRTSFRCELLNLQIGNYLTEIGEFSKALTYFHTYIENIKKKYSSHLFIADGYFSLGVLFFKQENYQDSIQSFNFCLDLRKLLLAADNPELGIVYLYLGKIYFQLKHLEESLNYLKNCKKIFEKTIDRSHLDAINLNISLGNYYRFESNSLFSQFYDKVFNIQDFCSSYIPLNAEFLVIQGELWAKDQNLNFTSQCYQSSFRIFDQMFRIELRDFESRKINSFYKNMAFIYSKYGQFYLEFLEDYHSAEICFKLALRGFLEEKNTFHLSKLNTLNALLNCKKMQYKYNPTDDIENEIYDIINLFEDEKNIIRQIYPYHIERIYSDKITNEVMLLLTHTKMRRTY